MSTTPTLKHFCGLFVKLNPIVEIGFRTMAKLETGDPRYAWVNNRLFVGSGSRQAESVKIALYEIC